MKKKPNNLIERLIDNKISRGELNEFLEGLDDDKTRQAYEEYLEKHFEEIMEAYQKDINVKNQEKKV